MCLNHVSVITDVLILLLKIISTSDVIYVYIRVAVVHLLYVVFVLKYVMSHLEL